jgi:hypothetical protein
MAGGRVVNGIQSRPATVSSPVEKAGMMRGRYASRVPSHASHV